MGPTWLCGVTEVMRGGVGEMMRGVVLRVEMF